MKKLLLLCLLLAACEPSEPVTGTVDGFEIVTIDNCDYIRFETYTPSLKHRYGYTHKGDCKNPIHVCRQTNAQ